MSKNFFKYLIYFIKTSKGFTLIELLVVISIISLLSAIIMVNVKSARDKSIIAKSLTFGQSINSAVGVNLVGSWSFNEGAGNIVADSSGFKNNGTWSGTAGWIANPVEELGWTGQFNYPANLSAYVSVGDPSDGKLDFGTGDLTLSAWFYLPALPSTWKGIIDKGGSGSPGYGMEISSSNRITCSIQGSGGTNQHVSGSVPKTGVWHYAVCVFDRDSRIFVYLDGKEDTSASFAAGNSNSIDNSISLYIGSYSGSWIFSGYIDEVRLFASNISALEIQKNYADNFEKYKKITLQQ